MGEKNYKNVTVPTTNTVSDCNLQGDRHPFPYGGWAVIRIIMVVCVKLLGQALPRAWAVGTARNMAYTARLAFLLNG